MYKIGDLILVKFPFTNLKEFKLRPAIIISEYKNDFIILAISSNCKNGVNIELKKNDLSSGELLIKSYIKLNKITSIQKSIIFNKIGTVKNNFLKDTKKEFICKFLSN